MQPRCTEVFDKTCFSCRYVADRLVVDNNSLPETQYRTEIRDSNEGVLDMWFKKGGGTHT